MGVITPHIIMLDETDSTNRELKALAVKGAEEGTVVIARRQSSGRGRLGRSFFSPDGGLYMSILLRPSLPPERTVTLTTMAAVAAAQAIEELCGEEAGIKWVNDIFLRGRKVCGILTEAGFSGAGALDWAVVGIGVNSEEPSGGFPEELQSIAGALFPYGKSPENCRENLADGILRRFFGYYAHLAEPAYQEEYRRRLIVLGKAVTVQTPTGSYPARALDVDGDCRLLVEREDGSREWLATGEISVRLF